MRIERLTTHLAEQLLQARTRSDASADRVAARICADVERRGDSALLAWCRKLDGTHAQRVSQLRIPERAIRDAARSVSSGLQRALRLSARNIRRAARMQLPRPWRLRVAPGITVSQLVRPLDSAACYVPGGRFSLVSSLLMTAIPAQVAGVKRIIIACPRPNAAVLAAANLLGLREIYQLGGAQAIAAFAFGTSTIPRVAMICGPGNRYVAAAKAHVSSRVKIDMLAGPTELLVLAESGHPRLIAADVIAQAEHDPAAVALVLTTSASLAHRVQAEVALQLASLPKDNLASRALRAHGRILLAPSLAAAIAFTNRFAPEHLSIPGGEYALLRRIEAAGSVFLGPWSAQPFGDYTTGTNHVLPTSGRASARGGLSSADFVKCIAAQTITRRGFRAMARAAQALAQAEALEGHARAIRLRAQSQ